MSTENKGKNAKKKPFKWTKELVRLALNDGWTQADIAKECRTQQSIVSAWKKGSKKGHEEQLKPLLDLYGYKLRRNTFRVYWSFNTKTGEKTFYRVEGKVILSQAFYDARRDKHGKMIKKVPQLKLVVHHQGKNNFRVVVQSRIKFTHKNEELESSVEDAVWSSRVNEVINSAELINFIDDYALKTLHDYPSDANTLPFVIRQTLLNHGVPVDGIVEYPAVW
ncbi:hypothetical protein [Leucothrix pacifica]|uniref:Uncharacterized protein n=1 Tax=Leucothrix pacifica TaxID=1247513 RepID=A0A317C1H7_9GAMM|nr:hypothetical protein [Leucothrix pacifica]PWQ92496.1 hypothetical protein DKW60_21110 [Leucothrix pacifica]